MLSRFVSKDYLLIMSFKLHFNLERFQSQCSFWDSCRGTPGRRRRSFLYPSVSTLSSIKSGSSAGITGSSVGNIASRSAWRFYLLRMASNAIPVIIWVSRSLFHRACKVYIQSMGHCGLTTSILGDFHGGKRHRVWYWVSPSRGGVVGNSVAYAKSVIAKPPLSPLRLNRVHHMCHLGRHPWAMLWDSLGGWEKDSINIRHSSKGEGCWICARKRNMRASISSLVSMVTSQFLVIFTLRRTHCTASYIFLSIFISELVSLLFYARLLLI